MYNFCIYVARCIWMINKTHVLSSCLLWHFDHHIEVLIFYWLSKKKSLSSNRWWIVCIEQKTVKKQKCQATSVSIFLVLSITFEVTFWLRNATYLLKIDTVYSHSKKVLVQLDKEEELALKTEFTKKIPHTNIPQNDHNNFNFTYTLVLVHKTSTKQV